MQFEQMISIHSVVTSIAALAQTNGTHVTEAQENLLFLM